MEQVLEMVLRCGRCKEEKLASEFSPEQVKRRGCCRACEAVGDTNGGLSLRAYARHRGCANSSVQEAVKSGRLADSVTAQGKISSTEAADVEWAAKTRRPGPFGKPSARPNGLVSARELADAWGVSRDVVMRWQVGGDLSGVRYGKQIRFDESLLTADPPPHRAQGRSPKHPHPPPPSGFKYCSKCQEPKLTTEFSPSQAKRGSAYCRACANEFQNERHRKERGRQGLVYLSRPERKRLGEERKALAQDLGVSASTLREWVAKGIVPSVRNGIAAGASRLSPEAVAECVAEKRAAKNMKHCSGCDRDLPLSEFRRSRPTARPDGAWYGLRRINGRASVCKRCRGSSPARREEDRSARQHLSDWYVRQTLVKATSVPTAAIPPALVEAKRAQMMVHRLVNQKGRK